MPPLNTWTLYCAIVKYYTHGVHHHYAPYTSFLIELFTTAHSIFISYACAYYYYYDYFIVHTWYFTGGRSEPDVRTWWWLRTSVCGQWFEINYTHILYCARGIIIFRFFQQKGWRPCLMTVENFLVLCTSFLG